MFDSSESLKLPVFHLWIEVALLAFHIQLGLKDFVFGVKL